MRFKFLFCVLFAAVAGVSTASDYQVTLLHFSDIHGHLSAHQTPKGKVGGIAKFAGLIDQIRNENKKLGKETYVLFAGDLFTGTPLSSRWRGALEVEAMNKLKIDAMVVGNHEFDFTLPRLLALQKRAQFPILSANIFYRENRQLAFKPIHSEKGGFSFGILGLTTVHTPTETHPDYVKTLHFADAVETTKRHLPELLKSDFQIILSHQFDGEDKKLLKEFKEIDLILGGHMHPSPKDPYCYSVRKRLLCKTPAYGDYLGRIDLDVANKKWIIRRAEKILLDDKVSADKSMEHWLARYEKEVDEAYKEVVAYAQEDLFHGRSQETPLGNLITDAMREYTKSDVAFTNSGGIRYSLNKGPIRLKDVMTVLPFPNTLKVIELSGAELKEVIRFSFDRKGSGGFLQVSGIRLEGSAKKPRIYLEERLLKSDERLKVCTVDFLIAGGDGYGFLKDKKVLQTYPLTIGELFTQYLKRVQKVRKPPLGRILLKS